MKVSNTEMQWRDSWQQKGLRLLMLMKVKSDPSPSMAFFEDWLPLPSTGNSGSCYLQPTRSQKSLLLKQLLGKTVKGVSTVV